MERLHAPYCCVIGTSCNADAQDCAWVGDNSGVCTATEKYPGMWELPLWNLPDEDGNNAWSMDVESKDPKSAVGCGLTMQFPAAPAARRVC